MPITDSKPTSDNPQTQAPQNVQYAAPYPQQFEDDTIDLYELWNTLWNKKGLVIAVTVIAALGSVVYALQQPHIYRAEALLLPPNAIDVKSFNMQGVQGVLEVQRVQRVQGLSAGAFAAFKNNLSSRSMQKKFIEKHDLLNILAPNRTPETRDIEILEGFSKMIKIESKGDLNFSVSTESGDPEFAAKLVNDYVSFFDLETVRALVSEARNTIEEQIRDIEYTIGSKREIVKQRKKDQIEEIERTIKSKREIATRRREDKVKRYEEAAKTAKALGIRSGLTQQTRFVESSSSGRGEVTPLTSREKIAGSPYAQMNVDIATATTPLFFIGFDALNAELKNLEIRIDEDPFIPGLRDLQEQLSRLNSIISYDPFITGLRDLQENLVLLRSIKFEEEGMHAVKVDQAAYPPKNPIKPNRRLIVWLGTVVGLFLGIFLVFLVSFIQKQKEIHFE